MSENPYHPPVAGVRSGRQVDLLKIARRKRRLMWCILIQIVTYFLASIYQEVSPLHEATSLTLWFILSLTCWSVLLVGGVMALILAWKVYHPAIGLLLGILAFVPCLGPFPQLLINLKASRVLKASGVRVGLLGTRDLSPIHDAMAQERAE